MSQPKRIALEATLADQVDELARDLGVPIRWA